MSLRTEFGATPAATIESGTDVEINCGGTSGVLMHVVTTSSLQFTAQIAADGQAANFATMRVINAKTGVQTAAGTNITPSADDLYYIPTFGAEKLKIVRQAGSGTISLRPSFAQDPLAAGGTVGGDDPNKVVGSEWNSYHAPAASTAATITQADPGDGKQLVITSYEMLVTTGATAPTAAIVAGTIVDNQGSPATYRGHSIGVPATAGITQGVALSGLNIPIAASQAATITVPDPGDNATASVAMGGYIRNV